MALESSELTRLVSEEQVRSLCDFQSITARVGAAISDGPDGGNVVPHRMNLGSGSVFLRMMPALAPSAGLMGFKEFHGSREMGVRFTIYVMDFNTGALRGIVDGNYLTAVRTAAVSAYATSKLVDCRDMRLAILGSGLEAETHLRAFHAEFGNESVSVFSPNEERREAFATRLSADLGIDVNAVSDPVSAVTSASHVVIATSTGLSRAIAYDRDWIVPGQYLCAIGSTNPRLRELDTRVFGAVDRIVVDVEPSQVAEESGDVIALLEEGGNFDSAIRFDEALADGNAFSGTTLLKTVGSAVQDLVAADSILELAAAAGVGQLIPEPARSRTY